MPAAAVKVQGLSELLRSLAAADKTLRDDLKDALAEAAAPVRTEAQRLAGTRISHMGGQHMPWARMRIGVRSSVAYIAPAERGTKGRGNQRHRRPNLANLLMDRAMEPALEGRQQEVADRFDKLLDEVVAVWEKTR